MSGEAILGAENSGKPLGGRSSAQNPAGELTALPENPSWWGGGLLPPPQEPRPALGIRPRFSGLIRQPTLNNHFPPILRGLDKSPNMEALITTLN